VKKALRLCAILLICLALSGEVARAVPAAEPLAAIVPKPEQEALARRLAKTFPQAHFTRAAVDDRLSQKVFNRYLAALDGQRQYFLASDIAEFKRLELQFDDMFRSGQLAPAYSVLARLRERSRERLQYATGLLQEEPDWTLDETFQFDRTKAPWPGSDIESNELWRKRVKADALSLMLTGKSWADAADILRKRYQRLMKRIEQMSSDDAFENLLNAFTHAFDPHSNYFSPRGSEEYRIQMSLQYEGIGAQLQVVDDFVTVGTLIEGGPASIAGTLKPNDRILAVAQGLGPLVDIVGWRIDDVAQLIRGKAGTTVRLQVLPAGAMPGSSEKIVELVRHRVTLESQAARKEVRAIRHGDLSYRVGIVTVPSFYRDSNSAMAGEKDFRSTTRDVRQLLRELEEEHVDALVLDLRNNGGGYLPEAVGLAGLFIDTGPVVQIRNGAGRVEILHDQEPGAAYSGPLAVLTNRLSASASEIVAGAIQDYQRGVVIGQRTFGKGTVQSVVPLDSASADASNGQLTITTGKFYRVSGDSTQHRGVEPDVALPSVLDLNEVGESTSENALTWDRMPAAPFKTERQVTPALVAALVREETSRAERDPDYRLYLATLQAEEASSAQRTISLNLVERRAERARTDHEILERRKARDESRAIPQSSALEQAATPDEPDAILEQACEIAADIVHVTSETTAVKPQGSIQTAAER
jgi:carboxyl-terminal processing protease